MKSCGLKLVSWYLLVNDSTNIFHVWRQHDGTKRSRMLITAAAKCNKWATTLQSCVNILSQFNRNSDSLHLILSQLVSHLKTWAAGPCGLVSRRCRWSPCIEANLGHSTERRPGPVLWRKVGLCQERLGSTFILSKNKWSRLQSSLS